MNLRAALICAQRSHRANSRRPECRHDTGSSRGDNSTRDATQNVSGSAPLIGRANCPENRRTRIRAYLARSSLVVRRIRWSREIKRMDVRPFRGVADSLGFCTGLFRGRAAVAAENLSLRKYLPYSKSVKKGLSPRQLRIDSCYPSSLACSHGAMLWSL